LLGPIIEPSKLSRTLLQQMHPSCARALTSVNFVELALSVYKNGTSIADSWCHATQETYFAPVGIPTGTRFSWNAASVQDIKRRNPQLSTEEFIIPKKSNRPFPIVGTSMVGPNEGGPYSFDTRNFTMMEITPLYIGHMRSLDVSYKYNLGLKHTVKVGGAIEPFAFGRYGSAPRVGLRSGQTTASLSGPSPTELFDIRHAGCASSYAPGAVINTFPANISEAGGLHFDYYSPSDAFPSAQDTLFCDGGSYENILLSSMLQRRVERIVLFINAKTPVQPATSWNVYNDPPLSDQISSDLSSFFGVLPDDVSDAEDRAFDNRKNQMFPKDDWYKVASALQKAQADGNGIIATFNLTTVENVWWGIPAGITSQITFVYLGRLAGWEAELSSDMRSLVVPSDAADAADLSVDVNEGPFKGFPHYVTAGGITNYERANVLADLTGWSVLKNADLFRSILS